jgi:hypothetical protein
MTLGTPRESRYTTTTRSDMAPSVVMRPRMDLCMDRARGSVAVLRPRPQGTTALVPLRTALMVHAREAVPAAAAPDAATLTAESGTATARRSQEATVSERSIFEGETAAGDASNPINQSIWWTCHHSMSVSVIIRAYHASAFSSMLSQYCMYYYFLFL